MAYCTIINHPIDPTKKLVKIYSCGRVYAASWAEPFPTEKEALRTWASKGGRRIFLPFNESTNTYLS